MQVWQDSVVDIGRSIACCGGKCPIRLRLDGGGKCDHSVYDLVQHTKGELHYSQSRSRDAVGRIVWHCEVTYTTVQLSPKTSRMGAAMYGDAVHGTTGAIALSVEHVHEAAASPMHAPAPTPPCCCYQFITWKCLRAASTGRENRRGFIPSPAGDSRVAN